MKRSIKKKQNYLITQLVKGVPLEKIDTCSDQVVVKAQSNYRLELHNLKQG